MVLSCGSSDESSGSSAQLSQPNIQEVVYSGSSGTTPVPTLLTGTIVIDWTYPDGTGVEGFHVYIADNSSMTNQVEVPNSPVTDHDVGFPASTLGTDENKQWWFTIEAYRGDDTAKSAPVCFTPSQGMGC